MKYIFFDIDGTLKDASYPMSEKTIETLRRLKENGHKIFLSTGRNKASLLSLLQYDFDGIVASAGAYVEVDGHILLDQSLSDKETERIVSVLKHYDAIYNLEPTNTTYISEDMLKRFALENLGGNNSELDRMLEFVKEDLGGEDLSLYKGEPVHKICFIIENPNAKKDLDELEKDYRIVYFSTFDGAFNGELNQYEVSKGIGIKKILDYYNADIKDTIAFGDSMNDLEMIELVEYGVVMENGSDELKQYASSICESVQEEGIYKECKRLKLI